LLQALRVDVMKDRIRQPKKRGLTRVPVIMQMEEVESGACALAMIAAYYGKWLSPMKVREDTGVSRDGANAANIVKAAEAYGLRAQGFGCTAEELRNIGSFPCIIHWKGRHFVVLRGFFKKRAFIVDPARGALTVPAEEFEESFSGVCLLFEPGEGFRPEGEKKNVFRYARKWLTGAKTATLFVMLTIFIGSMFDFINPLFAGFFMDRVLTGENAGLLMPFLFLLVMAGLIELIVSALGDIYRLKLNARMDVVGSSAYMWKMLRLPMEFFSHRLSGDLILRQQANVDIAASLVDTFVPLLLQAFMMLFFLYFLLEMNVMIALVGLLSVVLNLFVSRYISAKRVNIMRARQRDAGRLASASVNGIEMMESIKSCGGESGFFQNWAGLQAAMNTHEVRYERVSRYLGVIPPLLSAVASASVLFLGVWLIMQGRFSLGMIQVALGLMEAFLDPAESLIFAGQTLQEMRTDMERVDDVMEYPVDRCYTDRPLSEEEDYSKLTGDLELKHVTFGYSKMAPPILSDASMHVKAGSMTALVGASGSGKSTVARLITGLYEPWSGEILFDGKKTEEIDRNVFKGSVAAIEQNIVLFDDTIEENITMWDESVEDYEMILAARDAGIFDHIMAREGGFEGRLAGGGREFSGGEREQLEITRVLAQDPSILILDEAAESLDAETERRILRSIRARGITCVIIAQRESTLRECDEIYAIKDGHIAPAEGGMEFELV